MWNAQSHQIWQKSRPVAFNLESDTGGESRRWTVGELLERFKNLGICASRASVTAVLAELGLELELSGSRAVAPA
jgi:hypothetical protein